MLSRSIIAGFAALCLAGPIAAQEQTVARYTISVSGLTAGKLTLAARHDGTGYALTSNAASAGMAGLFRSFSLTTRAQGTQRNGRLVPDSYSSRSEGARAQRGADLTFRGGVATVVRADAPNPDAPAVDPQKHRGAVDPLTGFYAVLRDTTPEAACQLDQTMFDGHRISRVTVSSPKTEADGLICQGVYRRVTGYAPDDMEKRREFAFAVTYRRVDDLVLRVSEVSMDSLFGPARMTRDD